MASELSKEVIKLWKEGKREEAEELLKQSAAMNAETASEFVIRATALRLLKRPREAMTDIENAIRLDSKNIEAHMHRGYIPLNTGNYAEALAAFEDVIRMDPTNQDAWNSKINTLLSLNRHEEALNLSGELAERFPDRADFWRYSRSGILCHMDRFREALDVIEEIGGPSNLPDIPIYSYYLSKAVILTALERYNEALDTLEIGMKKTLTEKGCVSCLIGNCWRVPEFEPLRKPPYRQRLETIIGPKPKIKKG